MDKYQSAMILSAVGDAIGFKKSTWKNKNNGLLILEELEQLGGLESIIVSPEAWPVSASVIMHMATGRALVAKPGAEGKDDLYDRFARHYVHAFEQAANRCPDPVIQLSCMCLHPGKVLGWHTPYNQLASGYGAATKAMCIGLVYDKPEQIEDLIAVATECGRMTHNHPLGFAGSVCTALFTSYILQSKPITSWGRHMLKSLDIMKIHCKKAIRHNEDYRSQWDYFEVKWEEYLKQRKLAEEEQDSPLFPENYDMQTREKVYKSWSSCGKPGRRGHDAPMIAYDALLAAQKSKNGTIWTNLCHHAMIHAGDSDASGGIAGFWYGLMYGMEGVPDGHHKNIEFRNDLENLGEGLFKLAKE